MEIKLSNISYKDKINNFNYTFKDSKVTAIMGKSGSGKSLIGYLIMGLVDSYRGSIIVDGSDKYNKNRFMKDVGYVFQNPLFHFFSSTVREEIGFGLKQFRFKLPKMNTQIMNSLKALGLPESFLDRKVNTLSSGDAELVAIASSIVLNPKVLILDEPTVFLDYTSRRKLVKLIRMLRDKYNKSVIIISNDVDFVYEVSDEYILMDNYSIVRSGNISDIMIDDSILESIGYEIPLINRFVDIARKNKNIDLGYTNDIDKLVMEVIDNER